MCCPTRLADTFAEWLCAYPGAEVICRDRASGFAEGARLGAAQAIQVADRFHLLYNLTDAVARVVRAHRKCLQDRPGHEVVAQPAPPTVISDGRRAELTRQRHAEVHALWDKGVGTTTIAKALSLDDKTVRRYAWAATAEELLTEVARRGSELDAHTGHLARRWQEGCTNAARLATELRERGYRGSERSVRRLLQTWRDGTTPPAATPTTTPKPRQVTGWIIRPAADRTEQEQADLARILDRCQPLRILDQLVSDFASGLLKDYDAVRNGLTLPLEHRRSRGSRRQTQIHQTANVRPSQLRPPPAPGTSQRMIGFLADSRTSCQSQEMLFHRLGCGSPVV